MPADPTLPITIREAFPTDISEVLRLRRGMYEDMGYNDADALNKATSLSCKYLQRAMAGGSFRAWLACSNEREPQNVIAGGAVIISPWPAHPYDLDCRRAIILNVYTHPAYRRRGIARKIMRTMIEWCKQEGFARITLHASEDGRALYESLGFETSNEMCLKLR